VELPSSRKETGHANSVIPRALKLKYDNVTTVLKPVIQFFFTNSSPWFDDDVLKEGSMNQEDANLNAMSYNLDK
jgi:hypothetical protein